MYAVGTRWTDNAAVAVKFAENRAGGSIAGGKLSEAWLLPQEANVQAVAGDIAPDSPDFARLAAEGVDLITYEDTKENKYWRVVSDYGWKMLKIRSAYPLTESYLAEIATREKSRLAYIAKQARAE